MYCTESLANVCTSSCKRRHGHTAAARSDTVSGTAVKAEVGQGPSTQHNRGFKSYERNEKDHHSVEILENGRCPNLESFAAVS